MRTGHHKEAVFLSVFVNYLIQCRFVEGFQLHHASSYHTIRANCLVPDRKRLQKSKSSGGFHRHTFADPYVLAGNGNFQRIRRSSLHSTPKSKPFNTAGLSARSPSFSRATNSTFGLGYAPTAEAESVTASDAAKTAAILEKFEKSMLEHEQLENSLFDELFPEEIHQDVVTRRTPAKHMRIDATRSGVAPPVEIPAMMSPHLEVFNPKTQVTPQSNSKTHHFESSVNSEVVGFSSSSAAFKPTSKTTESQQDGFNLGKIAENLGMDDILKARLLVIGAAALYGTNFAVVKILGEHVPVGTSTCLRFGLASLATLPWLLSPGETSRDDATAVVEATSASTPLDLVDFLTDSFQDMASVIPSVLAGMEVGLWNGIGYVAQAVGLQTTDASKSAFICSLAVVFVPILDSLIGKKMEARAMFGVLCAILGVGLLELPNPMELFSGASMDHMQLSAGDMFTFLQPVFFGMGFWRMEHAMRKYPKEASRMTAGQLLSVAILSSIFCFSGVSDAAPSIADLGQWLFNPMVLGALIWTGVVTTAFTVYMETLALKTVSAAEATLIFSTEPVWGAGFASLLVGETLGVSALIGAALILSGCVVSTAEFDKDGNK